MCRFVLYSGNKILLHDVLIKPSNSLISQSFNARETDKPLNADGFGLGWYDHTIDEFPAVFKSLQPAWSNLNLVSLSAKIKSSNFFAHVRAASEGCITDVNCHPFQFEKYLFMHNGTVYGFKLIRRCLSDALDDDIYNWLKGQTDSEHVFALFIQTMRDHQLNSAKLDDFINGLKLTIDRLSSMLAIKKADPLMFLNLAITDGIRTIACRYISDISKKANTLYYAIGDCFIYQQNSACLHPVQAKPGAILISSEKLTDYDLEWKDIPSNHCIAINEDFSLKMQQI